MLEGDDGEVAVRVNGRLRANNGDVLCDAARDGQGIALLPDFIVRDDVLAGRLVVLLGSHCRARRAIYAVYPPGRHLSGKVRRFVDFLIDRFGGVHGVRDRGLLESALFRPQTGYYTHIEEMAAAMFESLLINHAFVDGNKRVAFFATDVFLRLNGWKLANLPLIFGM